MSVTAISAIRNTEPKNVNIPLAAAAGGAAGLALRQALPVRKPEIDAVLFGETDTIKANNIKHARKNAIDEVVRLFKKDKDNEALKLFLERTKASVKYANILEDETLTAEEAQKAKQEASKLAKIAKQKIKAASADVQKEIQGLTQRVVNKVRAARNLSEASIKTSVRQMRPYAAFMLPGIALGVVSAFVYNVVGTISED